MSMSDSGKPGRKLGELSVHELLESAESEMRYADDIAHGKEKRTVALTDGKTLDMLIAAIASARARLIVARSLLNGRDGAEQAADLRIAECSTRAIKV